MANASPKDARKNEAMAHMLIEQQQPTIAAKVGLHALAQLADMMPHEEFTNFINDALQEASTGQQPPDEDSQGAENSGG